MSKYIVPTGVFVIGIAVMCCGLRFEWFSVQALSAAGMPIVTLFALSITWFEYLNHKKTQQSKVFNKLNDVYYQNPAVRKVGVYLSNKEKNAEEPSAFEIEAFLRFFEELQVFIEDKQISREMAYDLFSYYCLDIMNESGSHHSLLEKIEYDKKNWVMLEKFCKSMNEIRQKRSNY